MEFKRNSKTVGANLKYQISYSIHTMHVDMYNLILICQRCLNLSNHDAINVCQNPDLVQLASLRILIFKHGVSWPWSAVSLIATIESTLANMYGLDNSKYYIDTGHGGMKASGVALCILL